MKGSFLLALSSVVLSSVGCHRQDRQHVQAGVKLCSEVCSHHLNCFRYIYMEGTRCYIYLHTGYVKCHHRPIQAKFIKTYYSNGQKVQGQRIPKESVLKCPGTCITTKQRKTVCFSTRKRASRKLKGSALKNLYPEASCGTHLYQVGKVDIKNHDQLWRKKTESFSACKTECIRDSMCLFFYFVPKKSGLPFCHSFFSLPSIQSTRSHKVYSTCRWTGFIDHGCRKDSDCSIQGGRCLNAICACPFGTFFDPPTRKCVKECKGFSNSFTKPQPFKVLHQRKQATRRMCIWTCRKESRCWAFSMDSELRSCSHAYVGDYDIAVTGNHVKTRTRICASNLP